MAKKVIVELNEYGVIQLLKSQEMMNICNEYAYDALNKLGAGYKVTSIVGKTRVNASIKAETPQAIQENKKHNTILKAVGGMK